MVVVHQLKCSDIFELQPCLTIDNFKTYERCFPSFSLVISYSFLLSIYHHLMDPMDGTKDCPGSLGLLSRTQVSGDAEPSGLVRKVKNCSLKQWKKFITLRR